MFCVLQSNGLLVSVMGKLRKNLLKIDISDYQNICQNYAKIFWNAID